MTLLTLAGFDIKITDPVVSARFELSEAVPVSDDYRHEFNRWSREVLGVNVCHLVEPGQVITVRSNPRPMMLMDRSTFKKLESHFIPQAKMELFK